jgi:hypothetical protein
VGFIDAASTQLAAHNTSTPLTPEHTRYLRARITNPLVRMLCLAARSYPTDKDWWGFGVCDFYKSVSWNLPEAGLFPFAAVQGLLAMRFSILSQSIWIHNTEVSIPTRGVIVPLPHDAAQALANVSTIFVSGLAASGLRGVAVSCDLVAPNRLNCSCLCEINHL